MIEGLLGAAQSLFTWPNPLWVIAGLLFGLIIGIIPGMAGSIALALLIPITLTMDTEPALLFLVSAYSPVAFGGQLTAILVNTPGAPENAATTFDGYPMTRQGRGKAAIGAAVSASVLGGLLGLGILLALIPGARQIILQLSFPEFFMMALVGLTVIAVLLDGAVIKGLIAAGAGLILAFIGLDPITGVPRLTFEQQYLWDGIGMIPVLLGLFAGAEALSLYGRNRRLASEAGKLGIGEKQKGTREDPVTFYEGVLATLHNKFLVLRATLIGAGLGAIPGVGGAVAGFIGYSHAKQSSKHPEKFGKGAVEGVIGAETANDAKEGGSLLPTVAFGIPGSVGMAVLLGALLVHGVPTGPTLMTTHMDIVYIIIIAMIACKFIAPVFVWLLAQQTGRITRASPGIVAPLVIVAAAVGVYSERVDIRDVGMMIVFGYVGYAMKRYGYSRVAFVLALVLGELMESSYYRTVGSFGGATAFVTRPISLVLLSLAALIVAYSILRYFRNRKTTTGVSTTQTSDDDELELTGKTQFGRYVFATLFLVLGLTTILGVQSVQADAQLLPTAVGIAVVILSTFILINEIFSQIAVKRALVSKRSMAEGSAPAEGVAESAQSGSNGVDGKKPGNGTNDEHTQAALSKVGAGVTTEESSDRTVIKRQLLLAAWTVGFMALAWNFGFGIAISLGLILFLIFIAREPVLKSLMVTGIVTGFLYLLFDVLINTPLIT